MKALKQKATEGATTKLLHANSSATTKKTLSIELTAALRAAATPRHPHGALQGHPRDVQ